MFYQHTLLVQENPRLAGLRRFGNGSSSAVRNWSESRRYIRIRYCPLLFLREASRNRRHQAEVTVSCVITWLPPNHRNSKRHRTSSAIQPQRKICSACNAAYLREPGFVLIADLASEIQMIHLFQCRAYGLSLTCKSHFIANVTKDICIIITVTRHH